MSRINLTRRINRLARYPGHYTTPSGGKTTGVAFTGGTGGANGKVTTMRIMDPRTSIGNAPPYPNGYVTYSNQGRQAVNPYTGQTLPKTESHFPIRTNE